MFQVKSQFEIKEMDEKKNILICYPAIFGVIDSDRRYLDGGDMSIGDMVMPGAFDKTIKEWGPGASKPRIKHLYQHWRDNIIGKPIVLKEDSKGLYTESQFGQDQFSRDKFQQHVDGLITEMSFGYDIMKSEIALTADKLKYTRLLELQLWEYSSVTWGANSMTEAFVGQKGADKKTSLDFLNERMIKFIKALRNPKYTDESLESFELEIKQIQSIINELLQEPQKSTPEPSAQDTLIEFRKLLKL